MIGDDVKTELEEIRTILFDDCRDLSPKIPPLVDRLADVAGRIPLAIRKDASGRELLLGLGPLLVPAREIRHRSSGDFDGVSDHELENAARALRALSYSCHEGARRLEAIRWARRMATGK